MKLTRRLQATALAVGITIAGAAFNAATADVPASLEEVAQAFLETHPGGVRDGNEVLYPDGSGFVAVDVGVTSIGQCSSNKFCMWSNANYAGSFKYVTGSGVTKKLSGTTKSFWNNRSKAARLYNNAGTSSTCHSAGVKKASLAIAYQAPAKVTLSSGTSC